MKGRGAWDDMPIFPRSAHGDTPPVGDPAFDALLARAPLPENAAGGLRDMAEAFAELYAAPVPGKPDAEARAMAAFRGTVGRTVTPHRSRPRRRPVLTSLLTVKLATAAAVVALGGAAAAAYTGALPASIQKLAHDGIGAPQRPAAHPTPTATSPGQKAAGTHHRYGLCTAYANVTAHGSAAQKAVAFRRLAVAAGGAARVTAYCATIPHPGSAPTTHPTHPTGKPTALPTHPQPTHAMGKPTSHP